MRVAPGDEFDDKAFRRHIDSFHSETQVLVMRGIYAAEPEADTGHFTERCGEAHGDPDVAVTLTRPHRQARIQMIEQLTRTMDHLQISCPDQLLRERRLHCIQHVTHYGSDAP